MGSLKIGPEIFSHRRESLRKQVFMMEIMESKFYLCADIYGFVIYVWRTLRSHFGSVGKKKYHHGVMAMSREKWAHTVDESLTCTGHASSRDQGKKQCGTVERALSLETKGKNPYVLLSCSKLSWKSISY